MSFALHFVASLRSRSFYSLTAALLLSMALVACQPAKPKVSEEKPTPINAADVSVVTGIGQVQPEAKTGKLNTEVSGIVTAIRVKEGAQVRAGETIIELSHDLEKSRVEQAETRIPTQKTAVEDAEKQAEAAKARIETANRRTQAAKVRADAAKVRYDRLAQIVAKGADTQQNLDNAKAEYDAAFEDYNTSKADATAATRDADRLATSILTARKRVTELEADLKVSQAQLGQRSVRAPSNGTMLSVDVTVGSSLQTGTAIGDFAPSGATVAICEIDELFSTRVQVGQKAYIRTQGMSDTLSTGTVIYAAPYLKKKSLFSADAGELEDRRVREIRIRLDHPEKVLLGARVDCVVQVK